VTSYMQLAH